MDGTTIRWLLAAAGGVVLWLGVREVTAYLFGYSVVRRGQLFLRLTIALLFLAALLSIERGVSTLQGSRSTLTLLYWLLSLSCLGGVVLLALVDAYMSKRRLQEEAKGIEKFLHPSQENM